MKLTYEQIASIAGGVSRVEEKDGKVRFFRFTAEQEALYFGVSADFYRKTFATAGVTLAFKTNSQKLSLSVDLEKASSRTYFSIDVFVNGKPVGYIDNYSDVDLPAEYTSLVLPLGHFSKSFDFGGGEKSVKIYLPWSCSAAVSELSLDDGATLEPFVAQKKIMTVGDSITQGYDALRPSNRYAAKIADALGAEERNKGIGGEIFRPALSELSDGDYEPDYITVAYGTNDSVKCSREEFRENCGGFYRALSKNYPNARIFAIAPIWRKNWKTPYRYGDFMNIAKDIEELVAPLENVTFINAFDFVPHDEKYFADLSLHPNDDGFAYYAENLLAEIKKHI